MPVDRNPRAVQLKAQQGEGLKWYGGYTKAWKAGWAAKKVAMGREGVA